MSPTVCVRAVRIQVSARLPRSIAAGVVVQIETGGLAQHVIVTPATVFVVVAAVVAVPVAVATRSAARAAAAVVASRASRMLEHGTSACNFSAVDPSL